MPEPLDDPERIIVAAIELHARGNVAALKRVILNELWEAGYDVRPPARDASGPWAAAVNRVG